MLSTTLCVQYVIVTKMPQSSEIVVVYIQWYYYECILITWFVVDFPYLWLFSWANSSVWLWRRMGCITASAEFSVPASVLRRLGQPYVSSTWCFMYNYEVMLWTNLHFYVYIGDRMKHCIVDCYLKKLLLATIFFLSIFTCKVNNKLSEY